MGEIIHYYESNNGFLNSLCGIEWSKIKDHTSIEKYVTCKKCMKLLISNHSKLALNVHQTKNNVIFVM